MEYSGYSRLRVVVDHILIDLKVIIVVCFRNLVSIGPPSLISNYNIGTAFQAVKIHLHYETGESNYGLVICSMYASMDVSSLKINK